MSERCGICGGMSERFCGMVEAEGLSSQRSGNAVFRPMFLFWGIPGLGANPVPDRAANPGAIGASAWPASLRSCTVKPPPRPGKLQQLGDDQPGAVGLLAAALGHLAVELVAPALELHAAGSQVVEELVEGGADPADRRAELLQWLEDAACPRQRWWRCGRARSAGVKARACRPRRADSRFAGDQRRGGRWRDAADQPRNIL